VVVLVVLLASAIPLFSAKQTFEVYTGSYKQVWRAIFTKAKWRTHLAFISESLEFTINSQLWPLFMFVLAISFSQMGGVTSFALFASGLFMLYVGRLSDTAERPWLLNIGAVWTAVAWILKTFVANPFDALLAHTIYRVGRSAANIPFQTFLYERAAAKEDEADEFIIMREVLMAAAMSLFFAGLALLFFLFPALKLNMVFVGAAVLALGMMLLGNPPHISLRRRRV